MTSLELIGERGGGCEVIESYELFAAMRRRHGFTQSEVVGRADLPARMTGAERASLVSELSRWERGRLVAGGARSEAAARWAWASLQSLIASATAAGGEA